MFFLQHVTHAQNLYQQSAVPAAELKLVGCVEEAVPRSASDVLQSKNAIHGNWGICGSPCRQIQDVLNLHS